MSAEQPGQTPDLRMQRGPHVFVHDLHALELADDDRAHLSRSLRLRTGDPLTASNGAGQWCAVSFGDILEPVGPIHQVTAPTYPIGLAIALTKAAKPEFAVQKATELGLDEIVVFEATHSVARWDETKRSKALVRLTKVAREAAMQSRRVTIPSVAIVDDLVTLATQYEVARADFGGVATDSSHRFIAVGPEGGWSNDEIEAVPSAVDLGSTVLRAETAAVVAGAFLAQTRRNLD